MPVTLSYYETGGLFGVKRYAWELARALTNEGATVLMRDFRKQEYEILGRRVGGNVLKRARRLRTPLARGLLHALDHYSNPTFRAADVVTVHDLTLHNFPGWFPEKEERASLKALKRALRTAEVITDCAFVRDDLIQNYGGSAEKITVVPLAASRESYYPDALPADHALATSARRPGFLTLLVFMSLEPRKRVDLVLEAAAQLPYVHVIHVGRIPDGAGDIYDRARAARSRLDAENRLTTLPTASDDLMRRLFSTVDVYVSPSLSEGWGFPPLEAAACGARVLLTDIPAHREVVGPAARYFEPTVESLREVLQDAWTGERVRDGAFPARETRLARAEEFSWARTARETLAVYDRARPGAARALR